MGLNLHKDVFADKNIRKAIGFAMDRRYIVQQILSDEVVPNGVIPPGMAGYDKDFKDTSYDPRKARLLSKASLPTLTLLHTDGLKTIKIARAIERNLKAVGIKVKLKQVAYAEQAKWEKELASGQHHLFLMGYKASSIDTIYIGDKVSKLFHAPGCENLPGADNQIIFASYEEATAAGYTADTLCKPQPGRKRDTLELLEPLFHSKGSANFTFYANDRVDALIDQLSQIDTAMLGLRVNKFKDINSLVAEDAPVTTLFYISKL